MLNSWLKKCCPYQKDEVSENTVIVDWNVPIIGLGAAFVPEKGCQRACRPTWSTQLKSMHFTRNNYTIGLFH